MDNPTRWNISNSAQNIVSALVDPSKQFDGVFRREWSTAFAGFSRHRLTTKGKTDIELKAKLTDYLKKLENRRHIKTFEAQKDKKDIQQQIHADGSNPLVPEIFMREDFDLSDLSTFLDVVSIGRRRLNVDRYDLKDEYSLAESSDLIGNHDSTLPHFGQQHRSFKSNLMLTKKQLTELQQNLTDYLDIIEEKLASQISNRSGDFFQVMSSVDSVMDELSRAIKSVTNLRKKCAHLNASLIVPNMKCIRLNTKRENAQSVLTKMNEIAYLFKVQPTIQILLSASDFVGALDLIAKSRIMLHKDLTRVICLRHLESQLNEIERMIGTMMQQEFLTLISSEWDGSLNQQSSAATRLSKLFDYFANGYSEIPERGNLTLLSLLQIQAEKFVNQFHEERKKRVESTLDIEQWKVVEVPLDFQRLITMIVDEKLSIGEIFSGENMQQLSISRNSSETSVPALIPPKIHQPPANGLNGDQPLSKIVTRITADEEGQLPGNNSGSQKHKAKNSTDVTTNRLTYVKAAGCTYVIVNSVINLVRTIMDYCKCAHDIRSLSTDLVERLFKILLIYNKKTYHLVFSAGAVQVAGLKTITTRSLVVSQRSLKLITLLIDSIKRHFTCLLPDGDNRLRRFDEIKAIYAEHAAKIPERVKTIVKDVINLQLQDWEAKPPVPSQQFNSVSQHFARLHENIQDALPRCELEMLFSDICGLFKHVLMGHLRRLNISADAGPQHWLVTQELTFYRISLSKLSVFTTIELNFDDLWSRLESRTKEHDETDKLSEQKGQSKSLSTITTTTKSDTHSETGGTADNGDG